MKTLIRLLLKEQSDQGLHCLHFFLNLLVALLYERIALFQSVPNVLSPRDLVFRPDIEDIKLYHHLSLNFRVQTANPKGVHKSRKTMVSFACC